MITRHYYFYAIKYRDDGSGSFSWCTKLFSVKSWLVNPGVVYQSAYKIAKEKMKNKQGGTVAIQSINRL